MVPTHSIVKFVRGNPHKFTYQQIAERFNKSEDAVRAIMRRVKIRDLIVKVGHDSSSLKQEAIMARKTSKELGVEARLESQLRHRANNHKELDKKYKLLQDELNSTKIALDNALGLMSHEPKVTKIVAKPDSKTGSGTAVALLSDVHCEEIVPKHKVNYLNEHGPDISKRRVHRFFDLLVRFIRVDRAETPIDNLILWLGGDFFTSDSHGTPTAFPPMIAAMFSQDLIVSGIQFLLTEEPKLNIHIVGSVGNHSRKDTARPVNQALEQELSLEWMMYHAIQERFKNEKRITFQLDNSYFSYVKVFDKTIRFCHGHLGFRYNDGLGGIHGPLWKAISQKWDKQIKADLTCVGHYHMYTPASRARQYVVNGSTIGASPYSLNFGYEDPIQAYFLVHSKYGIVGQRPLFVDT